MYTALRNMYGLTRPQLADLTGRSINYILKAEQLTFPSPPVALQAFYTSAVSPSPALADIWEPQEPDILASAYRSAQRATRETWLADWMPQTGRMNPMNPTRTFCRRWINRRLDPYEPYPEHPTQYAVSRGLCLPAATVFRMERDPSNTNISSSTVVLTALSDLVEYCLSGRFISDYGDDEDNYLISADVVRLYEQLKGGAL